MKFGIFLGVQISPDESLAHQIEDSAEQVRAARDAGPDDDYHCVRIQR